MPSTTICRPEGFVAIVAAIVTDPGSVAIPETSLEKPLSLFELS